MSTPAERAKEIKKYLKDPTWHRELAREYGDTCTQDLLLRHIHRTINPIYNQLDGEGYLQGILEHMQETGEL